MEEITGKRATINYKKSRSADMMETMADINKANQLLGWQTMISCFKGL
jgi:UDP-glucose 4-epimerase